MSHEAVGQLGGRRGRSATRRPASAPTTGGSTRSTTRATYFRVARPAQRAALAAGPPAARAGRLVARTARTSRPGTPRRSSPPSRRWRTRSEFYADLKARASAQGRDPEQHQDPARASCPVIGSTEARGAARWTSELERADPARVRAARSCARRCGVDPADLDLDAPLPARTSPAEDEIEGAKSRYTLDRRPGPARAADRPRSSSAGSAAAAATATFAGTPEQVADAIEEWFAAGRRRRLQRHAAVLPGGLEAFVDHVVPILQARGLFRTEYAGTTLRDHYGLPAARQPVQLPGVRVILVVSPKSGTSGRARRW